MKFFRDNYVIILFAVLVFLWAQSDFIRDCYFPKKDTSEKLRDTLTVRDTVFVPAKPTIVVREKLVKAETDTQTGEKVYRDSLNGTDENGSYKIKHEIRAIDDSVSSKWNIEIKPMEKVITNKITETIYKDIVKSIDPPFYKNTWFYISTIIALLGIVLVH